MLVHVHSDYLSTTAAPVDFVDALGAQPVNSGTVQDSLPALHADGAMVHARLGHYATCRELGEWGSNRASDGHRSDIRSRSKSSHGRPVRRHRRPEGGYRLDQPEGSVGNGARHRDGLLGLGELHRLLSTRLRLGVDVRNLGVEQDAAQVHEGVMACLG
uniref:Uncharacterized protein n=1 Tax=uncultured marine virus TaxID=186617 RepID=A0A0F7L3I2_9VIRU|nr:hypothetical protein [uncultured marine virus]